MQFKHVSPKNVRQLVPGWIVEPASFAVGLERALGAFYQAHPERRPQQWDRPVAFGAAARLDEGSLQFEFTLSDEQPHLGGQVIIDADHSSLVFPINAVLKGSEGLKGTHCIYSHTIISETPLSYVGITCRTWFKRFAEHRASAARGSRLVFHSALTTHADKRIQHRVIMAGVNFSTAMHFEEEFVREASLYPLGLNMIPGGFAGFAYLAKFGVRARTAEERDNGIEKLAARPEINGRPNPLCAARWSSDQDYVNRIVCGHSGRLTVDQVRDIRRLHSFNLPIKRVCEITGAKERQVREIARGVTYGRIA